MHYFFVARLLQAGKTFQLETPKFLVEAEIGFANAEEALKLGGTGIDAEINQIGNGGLLDTDAIVLVFVFKIENQVSSSLEVVLPPEMVGRIALFEPVGGLPFDFCIEKDLPEILA